MFGGVVKLNLSLSSYIGLWVFVLFLVLGAGVVTLVNLEMRQEARREAEDKARLILDHNLATHLYFSHTLKPAVLRVTEQVTDADYFEPAWMSSTFAVREIDKQFQALLKKPYYYKEAAVNARSPANEADPVEQEFIDRLNKDPQLIVDTRIRDIDGQPFFVVMRRGEVMEDSCLRCHEVPERAPGQLVEIYGPKRSFGRKVSEVVDVISIRIPLEEAFSEADRLSWRLSWLLIGMFVVAAVTQFLLIRHGVAAPLLELRERVLDMADRDGNDEETGSLIPLPRGRELRDLTAAFNALAVSLRQSRREHKRAMESMALSNSDLQQLAYVVSHDLRAPLINVNGFVAELDRAITEMKEVIGHGEDEAKRQRLQEILADEIPEAMSFIHSGVSRLEHLIQSVLRISRAGRRVLHIEDLDMTALVTESLKALGYELETKGIEVTVDNLPVTPADRSAMEQIFGNLLSNAVKYLDPSRPGCIRVTALRTPTETVFHVADNGRGMAEEDIPKAFELFRRVGDRSVPGEGMGLAYVKTLVARQGGTIWCRSRPSEGSTFSFTVPLLAAGARIGDEE